MLIISKRFQTIIVLLHKISMDHKEKPLSLSQSLLSKLSFLKSMIAILGEKNESLKKKKKKKILFSEKECRDSVM